MRIASLLFALSTPVVLSAKPATDSGWVPIIVEPLQVISWNVESGGADPAVISRQLGELPRADIYALQEVDGRDVGRYGAAIREAHGKSYRFLAGWTGRSDRLMVAWSSDRMRLLSSTELYTDAKGQRLNDFRHRSPLMCQFVDNETDKFFNVINVHLARGDARLREEQAGALAELHRCAMSPALLIGDFNFDYVFKTGRGNPAFDRMLRTTKLWKWAKPKTLVDTNWSDRDGDGRDNYPDSCLDFVFYSNSPHLVEPALRGTEYQMEVRSEVIVRPGDFPDDERTSDHRPIMATVERAGYRLPAGGVLLPDSPK